MFNVAQVGLSIVFSAAVSWGLYGTSCTPAAAAGIALVIAASILYQTQEARPAAPGSYARLFVEPPVDTAACDATIDEPAAETRRLVEAPAKTRTSTVATY